MLLSRAVADLRIACIPLTLSPGNIPHRSTGLRGTLYPIRAMHPAGKALD